MRNKLKVKELVLDNSDEILDAMLADIKLKANTGADDFSLDIDRDIIRTIIKTTNKIRNENMRA